jgi:hypothetical protein
VKATAGHQPPQAPPPPGAITALAGHLAADCGTPPVVEHTGGRRWRVTVDTGRVRMWVTYQVLSRGRLDWVASQLFMDGVRVERADSYEEFLRIVRDPDGRDGQPPEVFVEVDPADAPAPVYAAYRTFSRALPGLPAGTRVGVRRAGRRWQVVVENDRMCVRCGFVAGLMNPQRPQRPASVRKAARPVELVLDGVDVTEQINGRLDRALAMLRAHPGAPRPPVIGHERPAAADTGVRVRQQVVLRL